MRSPTMTGDEWPGGSSTFQITFVSGPMASGSLAPSATPVALGPRNCGQSAAMVGTAKNKTNRPAIKREYIEAISEGGGFRRGGYCTGFRHEIESDVIAQVVEGNEVSPPEAARLDRKSTRLNSSHS